MWLIIHLTLNKNTPVGQDATFNKSATDIIRQSYFGGIVENCSKLQWWYLLWHLVSFFWKWIVDIIMDAFKCVLTLAGLVGTLCLTYILFRKDITLNIR